MHIATITAFQDELRKIASSPATSVGAIGAGLSLAPSLMKEWDARHAERQALRQMPDKDRAQAREYVRSNRMHRAARIGVRASLAGAAGAAVGHYGNKALVGAADSASKKFTENLKPASEHAANVLSEGFAGGLRDGTRGGFWNLFKRSPKKTPAATK